MTPLRSLGGLLGPLALIGCTHIPIEPPAPVEPPEAREACEAFCDLYVKLQCDDTGDSPGADEVDGTADDVGCVRVCRDSVTGLQSPAQRACLDQATTCEAAEACIFGRAADHRRPSEPRSAHPHLEGEPPVRPPHEPVARPGGRPGVPRTPPSSLDGIAKSGGPKYGIKKRSRVRG